MKSLRWINHFNDLKSTYQTDSDRAAGILMASLLEDVLLDCLRSFLIEPTSKNESEKMTDFLESSGPLATFSARISLCYYLGLITETMMKDLTYIRRVRNHFAHHSSVTSFDTSQVRDLCSNLSTAQRGRYGKETVTPNDAKTQYLNAIAMVLAGLDKSRPRRRQRMIESETES